MCVVFLSGCDDQRSVAARERPGVRDSLGVRIINVPNSPAAVWDVGTVDRRQLHAVSDTSAEALNGRLRAVFLDDDNLFVANDDEGTVIRFDSNGTLRSRIGRIGGGPGEFREIAALVRTGYGAAAQDPALRRVTTVSSSGDVQAIDIRGVGESGQLVGQLADGALVFRASTLFHPRNSGSSGIVRPSVAVYTRHTRGASDTIATIPDDETYIYREKGGITVFSPPHERSTSVLLVSDMVYVATAEAPEVRRMEGGRVVDILRWNASAVPSIDRQYDSAYMRDVFGPSPPAGIGDAVRKVLRSRRPAPYSRVVGDAGGRIWIRLDEPLSGGAATWMRLEPKRQTGRTFVLKGACVLLAFGVSRALCRSGDDSEKTVLWTVPMPSEE